MLAVAKVISAEFLLGAVPTSVAYLFLRVEKRGEKRQSKGAEALCVVE
jgi:hypothetical protein